MNVQLRNSLTAREVIPLGDVNNLPTITEPDQTLSIKQIIERHTQGINLGIQEHEPYYSNEDLPAFEMMSFDELASYRQYLSEERYRLEDELKARKRAEKDYEDAAKSVQLAKQKEDTMSQFQDTRVSSTTPLRSAAETDAGGTRQAARS